MHVRLATGIGVECMRLRSWRLYQVALGLLSQGTLSLCFWFVCTMVGREGKQGLVQYL